MKINQTVLNSFQNSFLKELMGDVFMTDVRAEATFLKICAKYDVDTSALLEAANKRFLIKNAEFKALEARELASG